MHAPIPSSRFLAVDVIRLEGGRTFCSREAKSVFEVFTKREPAETSMGGRDVFNEKPTKEDQEQATRSTAG